MAKSSKPPKIEVTEPAPPRKVKVGDTVYITEFYRSKYVGWAEGELPAKVVKVMEAVTNLSRMTEGDYNRFVAKYGKVKEFPLISYIVQIGSSQFIVSEFGFEPK